MESIYLWPESPILSLGVLWLVSVALLWAARDPMLDVLRRLGSGIDQGLAAAAGWCAAGASALRERSRAVLLATGTLDLQRKLDREFHGIDQKFASKLGQYSRLHRRLDDLLQRLEEDYRQCGDAPPEVPGWSAAAQAIATIPTSSDPNVHKVLEGIRRSSAEGEKKALSAYREATARRHTLLGRMQGAWKEVRGWMSRMHDAVAEALEITVRIDGYAEDYQAIRDDEERAARALGYSAVKLFVVSLIVLAIALGGAFINFQLIALPMSELVPAGARIGGVPVSTFAALVIVMMEAAVGIFVMDMLGITELFPKLAGISSSRRRLILGVGLASLFVLASVEASLAILREQIVEADAALKLALAGETGRVVAEASGSRIPVIGQAVLGFVLPWVLAMVAIPLEMLLDSGRHVLASAGVLALQVTGHAARITGRVAAHVSDLTCSLYDVYIAVPLRIESWIRRRGDWDDPPLRGPRSGARVATGESRS